MNTPSEAKEIFADALEVPQPERRRFVESRCQQDAALRAVVEELLAAHERMGNFLEPRTGPSLCGTALCDRFLVVRLLGRGGMGEVYEALDQRLGTAIAIKVLLDPFGNSEQRFLREIQTARQITHHNVCRVFDYNEHEVGTRRVGFISMELLSGETLAQRMERQRPTQAEAKEIATQICAGLAAAHDNGIVHRDLKPSNIMVSRERGSLRVRIMDFGLAREVLPAVSPNDFHTAEGQILGTPAYMAPEQLDGVQATVASDMYSLGLVLYELFTGSRPFGGTSWTKRLTELPERPSRRNPDVSAKIDRAICRCLEPKPQLRVQSVRDVDHALTASQLPKWLKISGVAVVAGAILLAALTLRWFAQRSTSPTQMPENRVDVANLGKEYLAAERYHEAEEMLKRAPELKGSPDLLFDLGKAYLYDKRYDDATQTFREGLKSRQNDYQMWRKLGDSLSLAQKKQEAHIAFFTCTESADAEPLVPANEPQIKAGQALCYLKNGILWRAKNNIDKAFEEAPRSADVHFAAGVVDATLGDDDQAMKEIQAALKAGYPRIEILNEPGLVPLQNDRRFRKLLNLPSASSFPRG